MSKASHPAPKPSDAIQEEAMAMAKRVQKPGQTKEQTKLIAQGIAKGIELYRRQQNSKLRERDKARKRHLRARQAPPGESEEHASSNHSPGAPGRSLLTLSGGLFLLMALMITTALLAGWPIQVGLWTLSPSILTAAALLLATLAGGCLFSALQPTQSE